MFLHPAVIGLCRRGEECFQICFTARSVSAAVLGGYSQGFRRHFSPPVTEMVIHSFPVPHLALT